MLEERRLLDRRRVLQLAALASTATLTSTQATDTVTPPPTSPSINLPPHKSFAVRTADGLAIAAQEWGNPRGPEIVLIHGLSQSRLAWLRQLTPELLDRFRIVTYDLRGHGDSDKPLEENYYAEGSRWGDELAAVIETLRLQRPALVGWSLGGVVITNYLARHGAEKISAVNFVDAGTKLIPAFLGEESLRLGAALAAPDLLTRIEAIQGFLRACFEKQPDPGLFNIMLAYNAMTPIQVQKAMSRISLDGAENALRNLQVPVLVTHGRKDRLFRVALSEYTASVVPGASLSIYDDAGHTPFFEDSERFNAQLRALLARA